MKKADEKTIEAKKELKEKTRAELHMLIELWVDNLIDEWNLATQIMSRLMMFDYERSHIHEKI